MRRCARRSIVVLLIAGCCRLFSWVQRPAIPDGSSLEDDDTNSLTLLTTHWVQTHWVPPFLVRVTANTSSLSLTLESSFLSALSEARRYTGMVGLRSCRAALVGDAHGKSDVRVEFCEVGGPRVHAWMVDSAQSLRLLSPRSVGARHAARGASGAPIAMCIAPLYNVHRLNRHAVAQHLAHHAALGIAHTFLYTIDPPATLVSRLGSSRPAITGLHMQWVHRLHVHSRGQNWMNNDCVHRAGAHGFAWALSIDIDEFVFLDRVRTLHALLRSHSTATRADGTAPQVLTFGSRVSPPMAESAVPGLNATLARRAPVWCETRPAALVAREDALKFGGARTDFIRSGHLFDGNNWSSGCRRGATGRPSREVAVASVPRTQSDAADSAAAFPPASWWRAPWWLCIKDMQRDIDQHAALAKLGALSLWRSPEEESRLEAREGLSAPAARTTRERMRAERRAHNEACLDETIAANAARAPALCTDWRGRRKWLVETQLAWVANIHWASKCKGGECQQRHLHAADDAWLLHLSRPRDAVWVEMPGGGSSWDAAPATQLPPLPSGGEPRAAQSDEHGSARNDAQSPSRAEERGVLRCTNASLVWITVGRGDGKAAALFGSTPPCCHEHLELPPQWMRQFGALKRSFWRNRWLLVHEYLHAHPSMRYVVLSDAYDVVVNPMSTSELQRRFDALSQRPHTAAVAVTAFPSGTVARRPHLVLSTEDTCWIGAVCTSAQKDAFVRARLLADPSAQHRFMHSQLMGTREGVLDLIGYGLRSGGTDDMRMMYDYIVQDASRVAFDDEEAIFATFARGFVAGVSTSSNFDERSLMCWDGVCAIDRNGTRSVACSTGEDGALALHDPRQGRVVRPLMWHVNGPSIAFVQRHPTCSKGIESASGWTWATFT